MASRHLATSTAMLARAAARQASGSAAPLARSAVVASRWASTSSSTQAQQQEPSRSTGNRRQAPAMTAKTGLPRDTDTSAPIQSDLPGILEPAKYHAKTHNHHVATLRLQCYAKDVEHENMHFFAEFAARAGYALGIPLSKPVGLPMVKRLWTVVRSPFVHKKSMENFERRTYKVAIKVWDADLDVVEKWLAFLRVHSIDGVLMRAEIYRRTPLSIGQQIFEASTDNLRGATAAGSDAGEEAAVMRESQPNSEKIAQLGDQIVKEHLAEHEEYQREAAAEGKAKDKSA